LAGYCSSLSKGSKGKPNVARRLVYYIAAFTAAFLLFQVQPMMSKALLPVFGGSYLVWAACMMFFQAMLLLGYLYVHGAQKKLGVLAYGKWHRLLLFLPLLAFPFRFDRLFNFSTSLPFILAVPYLVLVNVGLPFFALSTMSVILQSWFYKSGLPGRENPYFLYGASNLGSMLALLTYPVLFEPFFDLKIQGYLWWIGYLLLIVLSFICLPRSKGTKEIKELPPARVNSLRLLSWFALSAAGCVTMLAVTNIMTFDIAPVPFLWIIPLAIYLFTFVLVFRVNPWFPEWAKKAFSWAVPVGIVLYLMTFLRLSLPPLVLLSLQSAILFIVCLNCHGRLVEIKPRDPARLTIFYLMLASGGFAGGVLVSTVMPLVSKSLLEYPFGFLLSSLALALAAKASGERRPLDFNVKKAAWIALAVISLTLAPWALNRFFHFPARMIMIGIAVPVFLSLRHASKEKMLMALTSAAIMLASNWTGELALGSEGTRKFRNFYGIYQVYESGGERYLQHGTTLHGRQYLSGPKLNVPLSFFHPTAPAGELLSGKAFNFKDIGMIGLGTGALAAYSGKGDTFTIYELDRDCLDVAERFFSYLRYSREKGAEIKFIFGDGRISLRETPKGGYDLLIIDAFNSGSIPVHLLTLEAIEEYFRVIRPGGLLLMHISNRALDLAPVIYAAADELKLYACEKTNEGRVDADADLTVWMALTRDKRIYKRLVRDYGWDSSGSKVAKNTRPWTDRYSNLFGALR